MKYRFVIVESAKQTRCFTNLKEAANALRISYCCARQHMVKGTKYLGYYQIKCLEHNKFFYLRTSQKGLEFYERKTH